MSTYKITLFGVKETTQIIAEFLYKQEIKVDLIVSIDKKILEKNHISDYMDLAPIAKKIGAEYYTIKNYNFHDEDVNFFQQNSFQIGLVYGWQRLIPLDVIDCFHQGIYGFHASPDHLPKGRGRSPLNWGIILGKTKMYQHCFRYVKKADAGDIYSITAFSIQPQDTILTLLYKSLIIAKKEIIHLINDATTAKIKLTSQQGQHYDFPKRTPADGLIDFTKCTTEVVNLIRGVTKPFPGAFCYTPTGKKIIIWEAWPFEDLLNFYEYQAGEVVDNIYNMPVVKTKDGSIILKNYEGGSLKPNDKLLSHPVSQN